MDTKRLDLNLLVTLEALLAEQNVTKAAARLNLSQPAVSAQLNRLRNMFGDPLLIPAQRGMLPTAKAIQLIEPLQHALNQVRTTITTHQDFDPAQATMTVCLAGTDYLQTAVILPLAKQLRQQAPGIKVAIRNLDPAQMAIQLEKGDVDLALLSPEIAPNHLYTRHLFNERYVLIGRRNHPRLRDGITLEEYAGLEHVIVSLNGGNFVSSVDSALAKLGHTRNVALSAASFLFVPEIVKQSDFVSLVPQRLIQSHVDQLKVVEFPMLAEEFAVGMVWHARNHEHTAQRWLRDTIVRLMQMKPERSAVG
ncbi:LysR family transcriptional regulator [Chitinivorax sp. B]|uniref:LysR family transcriptional regulator n=1 Tax=Chitinivorax sp. B TaxID=2502235 RepID=UPI0010F84412|nr:LysR family transcriptional regulator [Chitinivorax sp. B]